MVSYQVLLLLIPVIISCLALWSVHLEYNRIIQLEDLSNLIHENPKGHKIFFVFTTQESTIRHRALCSIESAAKFNPNSTIYLLSNSITSESRLNYSNIAITSFDLKKLLSTHPRLQYYWSTKAWTLGKFWEANLSDAIRTALLFKYGGAYFDTDFISTKSTSHLKNVVGRESPSWINGAAMFFERDNEFLRACLNHFVTSPASLWGQNGPRLLTSTHRDHSKEFPSESVEVLSPDAFYPVHFTSSLLFQNVTEEEVIEVRKRIDSLSYGVHFWNSAESAKSSLKQTHLLWNIMINSCPQTVEWIMNTDLKHV